MAAGRTVLVAHRGGAPNELDNSAAAFEQALKLDVDMLELDVRQARDGTLVLLHDPVVHAEGRRWVVRDMQYDLLRTLLPRLLTLDEYLERFGQALPFVLDMKTHGYEREVIDALRRHAAVGRALISSGHIHSLRRLARFEPVVQLGLSRGHARTSVEFDTFVTVFERYMGIALPIMLRIARAQAVMLHYQSVDSRLVGRLHACGYRVFTWTVDNPDVARRLVGMGVDSITSNDPALIRQALDQLEATQEHSSRA